MDQIKIGKFISTRRKEKQLTQQDLAEKLNITNRAISKWENGFCLPDVGIMPELCKILDITINDLFSGETVDMKDNEKKLEENLFEMARIKEQQDKELLSLEIFIGIIISVFLLICVFTASFIIMPNWLRILLMIIGFITFVIGIVFAIRIEQIAGYYECSNCHHKYVPNYKSVLLAIHSGRTRYMKCPKCAKKSWHKKIISK